MATQIFRRLRLGRKGSYYCRVLVPTDLSAILNQSTFTRSLQTTEYRVATLRALKWNGQLAHLFLRIRKSSSSMKPEQIKALVQEYVTKALADGEEERHERDVSDDERESIVSALGDILEQTHEALLDAPRSLKEHFKGHAWLLQRTRETADELLRTHRVSLPHDSQEYQRLLAELLKAEQIVLKTEMERWEGNYHHPDTAAYSVHLHPATSTNGHHHVTFTPSYPLSEAIHHYLTHHEKAWAPRTATKKNGILDRFLQIIGDDVAVDEIKKPDCVRYRETLRKLPNNMFTKYQGKTVAQVLELVAKKKSYTPVSDNIQVVCEHKSTFYYVYSQETES